MITPFHIHFFLFRFNVNIPEVLTQTIQNENKKKTEIEHLNTNKFINCTHCLYFDRIVGGIMFD